MPIGERIAIYRRRRGLTQLVLAGLIGRSESWLSQVERGIRPIDRLSVLIDIAHVLKVNVTDLTGQPFSLAPRWRPADGGKARTRAPDGRSYAAGMTASATTSSIACGWRSWRRRS